MVSCMFIRSTVCACISDHVATEIPSLLVYQATWQLKYRLFWCIRPRGKWNTVSSGVSDHVAKEMPSVQVYQITWQLKCFLCRCIRQNTWQHKYLLCNCIRTRGNILKNTFTVSAMKPQILGISISYNRSSCNSVNKKIANGLCSMHSYYFRRAVNFLFSTVPNISLGPILYRKYFLYCLDSGAVWIWEQQLTNYQVIILIFEKDEILNLQQKHFTVYTCPKNDRHITERTVIHP
jgi:hypothetical protein